MLGDNRVAMLGDNRGNYIKGDDYKFRESGGGWLC